MKRTQRDTFARSAMKLLCTLLGIVLAVMVSATAAFQFLLNQIQYEGIQSPGVSLSELVSSLNLEALRGEGSDLIGGSRSSIVNILLIGQDRREGEETARSDSMILCTFDKKTRQITMTSFLRDLYVPIPGWGSNRINAAYTWGGMSLLKQTLRENFSLHIDGCVEVDFSQFTQIIDLLGGVMITLREDEARIINQETGSSLTEGPQVLNGFQALTYSRIRKLDADGDFSRTQRQRKVLEAIAGSYRQISLSKLVPLVTQILPMITTDMNRGQILMLALELAPNLAGAEMVSQRIPAEGTYRDASVEGMSVLQPDLEANREILRKTLLGE